MNQLTTKEIALRGGLSIALGVLAFLVSSPDFQDMVSKAVFLSVGALNAGLLAFRLFIDKSTAQGEPNADTPPTPVEIMNEPQNAVPVDEMHDGEK